jgi:CBS domain-containing protein
MRVKDLMAKDVVAVPASASVAQASEILRTAEVSGAPVIDEHGNPVGVISRTDLAYGWERAESERRRWYYVGGFFESAATGGEGQAREFGDRSVREVMMPIVFSVDHDESVRKAAELMQAEGIHRVLVLQDRRIVGVLSASAIVNAVARGDFVERA